MPALIAAGVFAATLSSALGSMMGSPRILQSLARDRLFRPLAKLGAGSGSPTTSLAGRLCYVSDRRKSVSCLPT